LQSGTSSVVHEERAKALLLVVSLLRLGETRSITEDAKLRITLCLKILLDQSGKEEKSDVPLVELFLAQIKDTFAALLEHIKKELNE